MDLDAFGANDDHTCDYGLLQEGALYQAVEKRVCGILEIDKSCERNSRRKEVICHTWASTLFFVSFEHGQKGWSEKTFAHIVLLTDFMINFI